MKIFAWLMALALWGTTAQTVNFDSVKPGSVPPGWFTVEPDAHHPARWVVVKDPSAASPPHVFAQLDVDGVASRGPLAILKKTEVKDGDLSVRVKPMAGKADAAGGLVWRYRDPENYYLVRANAVENTVALYKVDGGKITPLTPVGARPDNYAVKHPVPPNQWSMLKVEFRGPLFSVYFNHKRLFEVRDSTFTSPGKVGLWSGARAVTYFDDFRIATR